MVFIFHLIFIGIWVGCVLTEALFERALLGKGRDKEIILCALHKKVDIFIEVPAFIIVAITGAILSSSTNFTPLILTKITFGILAILVNIYCVFLVFKRADSAKAENWINFEKLDHLQHKAGALVLMFQVFAIICGAMVFY